MHYASSDKMKFFPEEGGSYFIIEGVRYALADAGRARQRPLAMEHPLHAQSGFGPQPRVTAQDPVTKAYEYIPDDPTNPRTAEYSI